MSTTKVMALTPYFIPETRVLVPASLKNVTVLSVAEQEKINPKLQSKDKFEEEPQ